MTIFKELGCNLRTQAKQLVLEFMKATDVCQPGKRGMQLAEIFKACGFDWGEYRRATSSKQQYWVVAVVRELEAEGEVEQVSESGPWRICQHSKQVFKEIPTKQLGEAVYRRAQRVLAMVHELHKAGYQQLRICPGMSPSGGCWRVAITHKGNILKSHGAMIAEFGGRDAANYTSGQDNNYFDWHDAEHDTARQLAQKFLERFSDICTKGRGLDHEYVGWYVQMLGFSERGIFPVSYADYQQDHPRWMSTTGGDSDSKISGLPKPPPGFAEGEVI
jgi:hypothetical protein